MRPCNNLINTPPTLGSKGSEKTTEGRHPLGFLLSGPGAILSGRQSPPGGPDSASRFPRRYTLPFIALLATLALGLLFLLPGGLLQAQSVGANCEENANKTGYDCEYAENGTDPVATFTATDPEGAAVSWDLDTTGGDDHALFSISKDGVLTFDDSPNYESGTDNMHEVTVRATDNMYDIAAVDGEVTTKLVMVEVTNEEEPGSVKLTVNGTDGQPVLQPQMGEALTATLSDGDTPVNAGIEWQWYRGSTEIIGATNGAGTITSAYTPVQADIGEKLTAKATYTDEKNSNDKDMAEDTTIMAVRAAPSSNNAPAFPDEDLSDPGLQKTPERKVAENTRAGRDIGAPVKANDEGDVLAYSLSGTDAGLFDIDIRTGQLKTKGKLNREVDNGDEREVTVTAVDPFGETDGATVTIEIENVDESPAIDERMAKAKLMYAEPLPGQDGTTPDPVLLWTYAAMDDEDAAASPAADLKWKLEGADRAKLSIGNTDDDRGQLKFAKNPDFEDPVDANKDNVYEVTVVVTDSDNFTDTLAVRVEVTNAKETGEVTFTVATPRVGVPLTAMLEDPDGDETGHEWQWMVADTDADSDTGTAIDGATSATFTPRDGDVGKFLGVKVKYTDGKGKDSAEEKLGLADAAVAVAAVAAPRFYDKALDEADEKVVTEFELELTENTATNMDTKMDGDIFVGHRSDDVESVLTYAVGGTDAASFKVVPDNNAGTVKLQAQDPLDYETKKSYSVEVTATDSDGEMATLAVTVTVANVDEMPAVSGSGANCEENANKTGYDCEYAENGTDPVATFTATDPEGAAVSWDLDTTGGDDHALFSISKDGVLTFDDSPNYESGTDNMHEVTVRATDNMYDIAAVDGEVTTKLVMVEVTNEEEPGSVKLTVNGTDGQPVLQPQMGEALTATLSDGDTPVNAGIEWQWYRGSTEIIGATNGAGTITSAYTPDESDIGSRLTAKATYMDEEDANNKKMAEGPTSRTVRRAPSSNNAPAFPDEDLSDPGLQKTPERKVAENTRAGRDIGAPVKANDEGDVLAYSLSGTDAGLFDIDIRTGQLKTKGKLNREVDNGDEREVTVTAVDPFGETDGATVTIEIENVDESPAIDERMAKAKLMYAEPLPGQDGTTPDPVLLWTYAAMDDEDAAASPAADLKWKLEGADRAKLSIGNTDDDRGQLKFAKNPDFEDPVDANKDNVYEVTVVVTDSDNFTDTLAVRVEVTNAKETGEVTFTVATPRVGVPLTAMLEDPDGDETGHEWQWMVADTDADSDTGTAIDGATSATFTPRDGDVGKFLGVKVKYTDGKGKDSAEEKLGLADAAVAVAAVAAPRFYDKALDEADEKVVTEFELELTENTATNMDTKMDGDIFVGHRSDDVESVLTYAVGGTDAASFKVVPDNNAGTVKLQAQDPLDYETKKSYSVEVTATDSDGKMATLAVTVTVANVDEMPMIMVGGLAISGSANVSLAEDDMTTVGRYSALGPMNDMAMWSLEGVDSGEFMVQPRSGMSVMLKFGSLPNYESPTDANMDNTYMVTLKATDGTYMDTHNVMVRVTNVEELGTLSGDSNPSYMEDGDDAVGTYTVSGGTMSGMANWSLMGDDMDDLSISTGGELTFDATPDFEMPMDQGMDNTYMVTVMASAGGEMDTQDVMVRVTNVDEMGTLVLSSTTPSVDALLTATLTDLDGMVSGETWMWDKSLTMDGTFEDISGARMMSYTPVSGDVGFYLRATVTYTDGHGSGKSEMAMTTAAVVAGNPLLIKYDDNRDGCIQLDEARVAVGDHFKPPRGSVLSLEDARTVVGLHFECRQGSQ